MKILITEEQYEMLFNPEFWLRRNYSHVENELKETMSDTSYKICRYDTYEEFESYFFSSFMDGLHPYYYDVFNLDYLGLQSTLTDMFYVECTEFDFKYYSRIITMLVPPYNRTCPEPESHSVR